MNLLIQRDIKKDVAAFGIAKSYELLNKKVLVVKLKNEKDQTSSAQQKWINYVNFEEKLENLIEVSEYNTKTLTVDYMDKMDTMPMNEVLFDRVLAELKQEFDVVLFTSDISNKYYTFVLSQLMQHTIYVASSKKTSINQADLDLKKLEQMNLEIIGMVLIQ
ncbi:hypothetical protein [Kurthia zopfii]|uniref:hypothetical protein n=1 Tax=Kurthia zopfii TaxID=1650 RepID=UPI000F710D73|nr:hypothetical protein [Kurthia zopfii]VEI07685.1 Capsular polysaccharide biosynthesis protein [Kurthia zopfii]